MPCPVCRVLPIPKGHAHHSEDLTNEAWPRLSIVLLCVPGWNFGDDA